MNGLRTDGASTGEGTAAAAAGALPAAEYLRRRREWRRHAQGGQSVIIAIIVLFLLLFLAGIFIAILVGNIKNAQRAEVTSASQQFAQAGIKYLDEQMTNSPEGADWRPAPDCAFVGAYAEPPAPACSNANIDSSDPDWRWLKPYNPNTGEGGYTRVNFGSEVPGSRNTGGRALVRVTYAPRVNPNSPDTLSRYIKIEAIGRSGIINPDDPTTFGNTDAPGQRVELVAYKNIGLNEYVRQVTNKDNKPVTVALGAASPVQDIDYTQNPPRLRSRDIENIIAGPVRVNANLTFFGVNRLAFNPLLNEGLEVAGSISLNRIADAITLQEYANLVNTNAAPTRVFIDTTGLVNNLNPPAPNLLPSNSPNFTTLAPAVEALTNRAGVPLVRDNPRGGETANLPVDQATYNQFQNLRSVGRTQAPLIDANTGANGLTRYRALTRNSAPLAPRYMTDNPFNQGAANNPVANNTAGFYGWGEGLYINNSQDQQSESNNLLGGYSLRADWMNPGAASTSRRTHWRGDLEYVPPAVSITLNPAYLTLEAYQEDSTSGRQSYYFRDENGQRITGIRVIRYTAVRPTLGVPTTLPAYQGYPADRNADGINGTADDNVFGGDYVIFAEGNVRVRGVVGGLDPQTGEYFKRHLTIVSNGTIYVDGNILRDNIAPSDSDPRAAFVRGNSSIALLAKNYVAVNTSQFLGPEQQTYGTEQETATDFPPLYRRLYPSDPQFGLHLAFGSVVDANGNLTAPSYLTRTANAGETSVNTPAPQLFLRHSSASGDRATAVNYFVNQQVVPAGGPNRLMQMPPLYSAPNDASVLLLNAANQPTAAGQTPTPVYVDDVFAITPDFTQPNNTSLLLTAPIGTENQLVVNWDVSYPNAGAEYKMTRIGVAPLDIRVEALMYAQEGAFFVIPGAWFNPNPNDTFSNFAINGARSEEVATQQGRPRVNHRFPFYGQPMDIRMTFFGAITENLPAEVGDETEWLQKWGWVPSGYGSTGLQAFSATLAPNLPQPEALVSTVHGPNGLPAQGYKPGGLNGNGLGNGIVYQFDGRARYPYADLYDPADPTRTRLNPNPTVPLRPNPYNPSQPLPIVPRLPVAPGLLYYGQNPVTQ